ncbi:MAG: DUF3667 domain-containing protein [Flavobacteriaceae bacterium]|nr:DUF3667 domain-containing protein [Flavobacteriaceae bacterium]
MENFLNYDNTFIKTNVHLVTRPAQVIHAYVNGIRKRYSSPISYFAISLTISGLYIFFVQKFYPDVMDMSGIYSGEGTQEVTRKITEFLMDYNSLFYFFLIPAMAFISRLVFLRNGYNYTEHVVIYLYTMSISAIISSLISIVMVIAFPDYYLAWGMTFNIMMVLYHCYILKQVFELSLFGIIKKTLLFLLIFLFFYIGISIIIGILLFVFGGFDPADFTPPQN